MRHPGVTRSQFGSFMRQHRMIRLLSEADLAQRIGCDVSEVVAVERNLRQIPGRYLVAWANELRLTPEQVVVMYVNQEARRMLLEAGVPVLFSIVPVDTDYALPKTHY